MFHPLHVNIQSMSKIAHPNSCINIEAELTLYINNEKTNVSCFIQYDGETKKPLAFELNDFYSPDDERFKIFFASSTSRDDIHRMSNEMNHVKQLIEGVKKQTIETLHHKAALSVLQAQAKTWEREFDSLLLKHQSHQNTMLLAKEVFSFVRPLLLH